MRTIVKRTRWMVLALGLAACSGRLVKVAPACDFAPYSSAKGAAWLRADSLWNLRRDSASARAALDEYRRAAKRQNKVPELLTRWARAGYFVATYVETRPDQKESLYLEGAFAAEKALMQQPGFYRVFQASGDEVEAVGQINGPFVASAFWYAANLGRLANLEGAKARIGSRERLEAFIVKVLAKNEGFYYGGAHRFLGVMYMVLPQPNSDSARLHFERALQLAPLYFGTRTLMAEYLFAPEKDTADFRAQLEFVLHANPDTLPEAAPENFFEQKRARRLLAEESRRL